MSIDETWLRAQFPDLHNLKSLGQHGGQKWVFSADHPIDGSVVLKVIKPGADSERIRREILAVRQVNCPRVPKIFADGRLHTLTGETIWIRERQIAGESLRAALARGPLQAEKIFRLAAHILEALMHAEAQRIVHRDVKPDNIMIDLNSDFWLLDFGIARHLDMTSQTPTIGSGIGTVGYSPPEQFRNLKRDIDSRTDLFALGVTIYEAATGRNPFRDGARDAGEVLRRIENSVLQPLTGLGATGEMSRFTATLVQRRREHRPATISHALAWLNDICIQEGIVN